MHHAGDALAFLETGRLLDAAVRRRVFPGAVAEIGDPGGPSWVHSTGSLAFDTSAPADPDTVYDLASLTKVVCTTTLAMQLVDRGRLSLETPVSELLPGWYAGEREAVTFGDLLAHSSGLPAWLPLYEKCAGRAAFERAIGAVPLAYAPRSKSVYSDLGFILLGFVLEDALGASLAAAFDGLLDALALAPRPGFGVAAADLPHTAPTQRDGWRGRLLRGEVDDRNAHALGGAAGHAGLFGTASSLGAFARRILRGLDGEEAATGVRTSTLRLFTSRTEVPGSSRALGWDTMLPSSSCGARLSRRAFGHTGFTGTSLWIDPERRLYAVLLTNRVHPAPGDPAEILAVRQAFHDSIVEGMEG